MVQRWVFTDPTDSSTATFEINPNEGGTVPNKKNITSQSTVANNGKSIVWEGSKAVPELTFSGTILTQTMYNLMVTWFNKSHQIQLTDDLSRVFMIYIRDFDAKRIRSATYPWKHTYTCTAIVLDWP